MGQSPSIGLGLAPARPDREVIVFTGDGSLLMNLGCLVTLAASGATNLTLIALDNGIYEVTGGQEDRRPSRPRRFRRAGHSRRHRERRHVRRFDRLAKRPPREVLKLPGPRFVSLIVEPVEDYVLNVPGPIRPRIERFKNCRPKP